MRKVALVVFVALFAAAVFPAGAEAQMRRAGVNTVEITPFVGFSFSNSLSVDVENMTESVKIKDGIGWGVVVDVPLNRTIALEALYTRRSGDFRVNGQADPMLGNGSLEYWHGGARFNLSPNSRGTQAFLLVTLGATVFKSDLPNTDNTTEFSFGGGLGATIPVSDSIGIRLEGRGFGTRTDLTQLGWICGYYTCGLVSSNQYHWNWLLGAGLQFGF